MTAQPRRSPWLRLGAVLAGLLFALPSFAQVDAVLSVNNDRLRGTNVDGLLLLFTPDPLQLGSSVSHWDSSATPNILMEPSINADLGILALDLTPEVMRDVGWTLGTSNFNVINLDPQGVGFTDPTPFAGAPGNPATTLGEARINLFNAVLAAWASTLASPVDIDVEVTWTPLDCQAGAGAVLAGAFSPFVFQRGDFPHPDTWYHSALAEALVGESLSAAGTNDIRVIMNSAIDQGCLGPGTGYYYGLDGQNPPGFVDQAPVVLHEVGHGLGFANFTNEENGLFIQGDPGIFDRFTLDTLTGQTWNEMTPAGRVASATRIRRVVWSGSLANAAADQFLESGVPELRINAPLGLAGSYEIGTAAFGPDLPRRGIAAEIACLEDAEEPVFDGCTAATNPGELAGRIALIDRGLCNFTTKVENAQAAGAVAAIIVNNAGDAPLTLGGDDTLPIDIPAVSLGQTDGQRLRQVACASSSVFLNGGRFEVSAEFRTAGGLEGQGRPARLTDDTGYFSFFDEDNVELVVKVLDACSLAGFNNFWVFAAGLTDVEVTLTVTDTQAGQSRVYSNPLGRAFPPIQDTEGFATCP